MDDTAPTGLWTISGPSGAGKSTLLGSIREKFPKAGKFKSVTTRPRRKYETVESSEYNFVPNEQYDTLAQKDALLWNEIIHGNRYGVEYEVVRNAFSEAERNLVLADIAYHCCETLRRYALWIGNPVKICSIYLDITDEHELRRRLTERTEQDLERRLHECREWSGKVRDSVVPFHIIDATLPPERVLEHALKYIEQT